MILTISERFALVSIMPPTGDITTLKDVRQLREELGAGQSDRDAGVQFFHEFKCPECEAQDTFPAPVKCGKCGVWLKPTGQVGCSNWEFEKEVPIPDYLKELITSTLKMKSDSKKLEERHISIFDKFCGDKE